MASDWLRAYVDAFEACGAQPGVVGGRLDPLWLAPKPGWLPERKEYLLGIYDKHDKLIPMPEHALPIGANFAAQTSDAEYEAVAEEYIRGYLAAHPLQGTALGFHEYDGKISDYSRLALDAELSRLRRFDDRLRKFDADKLTQRQSIDLLQ